MAAPTLKQQEEIKENEMFLPTFKKEESKKFGKPMGLALELEEEEKEEEKEEVLIRKPSKPFAGLELTIEDV